MWTKISMAAIVAAFMAGTSAAGYAQGAGGAAGGGSTGTGGPTSGSPRSPAGGRSSATTRRSRWRDRGPMWSPVARTGCTGESGPRSRPPSITNGRG